MVLERGTQEGCICVVVHWNFVTVRAIASRLTGVLSWLMYYGYRMLWHVADADKSQVWFQVSSIMQLHFGLLYLTSSYIVPVFT